MVAAFGLNSLVNYTLIPKSVNPLHNSQNKLVGNILNYL